MARRTTRATTDNAIRALEEATHLRGWAVQSFAQVEFMLGHFIRSCAEVDGYKELAEKPPRPFDRRVKRFRAICNAEGPFEPYKEGLLKLASEIEGFEEERHFLVHGWLEVLTRGDHHTLRLRRFAPQPPHQEVYMHLDVEGLRSLSDQITSCSTLAMSLFRVLYRDFELAMPDDD